MKRKFTDDQAAELISDKSLISIHAILARLGCRPCGGYYDLLRNIAKKRGIDISHWKGQQHALGKTFTVNPVVNYLKIGSNIKTGFLRIKLVKEGVKLHKCENCTLTEWLGKPIPLELHHVNGDKTDNRLENVQLLCPNCHSLTPNFCAKNIKFKKIRALEIENGRSGRTCTDKQ